MGRYCFHRRLSVHRGGGVPEPGPAGGGGYPNQVLWRRIPKPGGAPKPDWVASPQLRWGSPTSPVSPPPPHLRWVAATRPRWAIFPAEGGPPTSLVHPTSPRLRWGTLSGWANTCYVGGRYASCVHAGGLSYCCIKFFTINLFYRSRSEFQLQLNIDIC